MPPLGKLFEMERVTDRNEIKIKMPPQSVLDTELSDSARHHYDALLNRSGEDRGGHHTQVWKKNETTIYQREKWIEQVKEKHVYKVASYGYTQRTGTPPIGKMQGKSVTVSDAVFNKRMQTWESDLSDKAWYDSESY